MSVGTISLKVTVNTFSRVCAGKFFTWLPMVLPVVIFWRQFLGKVLTFLPYV